MLLETKFLALRQALRQTSAKVGQNTTSPLAICLVLNMTYIHIHLLYACVHTQCGHMQPLMECVVVTTSFVGSHVHRDPWVSGRALHEARHGDRDPRTEFQGIDQRNGVYDGAFDVVRNCQK